MSFIDKIDEFYNKRQASEAYIIAIAVSGLFGYLLYSYISPMASNFKKVQLDRKKSLNDSIRKSNEYLRSITVNGDREYKIKEINKKIHITTVELNKYRGKLRKIDSVMQNKLNSVLYTKNNWSVFLNSITQKAKESNLKLYNLSNTIPPDNNSTFGKVLEVGIKAQGKYGNILKFTNELEKNRLVTTIGKLDFNATKSDPIVNINMSVWGIKPWKKLHL